MININKKPNSKKPKITQYIGQKLRRKPPPLSSLNEDTAKKIRKIILDDLLQGGEIREAIEQL
jgi:hypothetical protein